MARSGFNQIDSNVLGAQMNRLIERLCSALGNLSGYRCVSDCKSRSASLILAQSHTLVEIDHEIISTVILLSSTESFKKGCCQLQGKVCAQSTGFTAC